MKLRPCEMEPLMPGRMSGGFSVSSSSQQIKPLDVRAQDNLCFLSSRISPTTHGESALKRPRGFRGEVLAFGSEFCLGLSQLFL
jgi:hypothetical protein